MNQQSKSTTTIIAVVSSIGISAAAVCYSYYAANRIRRSKWMNEEDEAHGHETTHSVIDHFKSLILDPETTVEEANKKRTTSYYLKMRESHSKSLVLGIQPYTRLIKLRNIEMTRILQYWSKGDQSHRTIVVMCDEMTRTLLGDARRKILEPLNYSSDMKTKGCWIPPLNIIPVEDMHVTIALPWWWHTIRSGNNELTKTMAQRFKQTLLLKFHYPFTIELERIILLGGKVIVALWRCVGDRTTDDGRIIHDRHGANLDPMVRLREEIIRCFVTESPDQRRQPLTYQHKMGGGDGKPWSTMDEDESLNRQYTIKQRTPGMGVSADGFIHTTLCRLPLECLSYDDIELDKLHRLCREASATLNGHRMVIGKYRFIETMGEGGESNPCFNPLYDEIIDAPLQHRVKIDGSVEERKSLRDHTADDEHDQRRGTIGPANNFMNENVVEDDNKEEEEDVIMEKKGTTNTLSDLFKPPD